MSQTLAALPPPSVGEMRIDVVAPLQIGRALRARWYWILGLGLVAFLGSLVFVNLATPRYTAEAKLLLESGDSFFTRPSQDRANDPSIDEQAVASQVQVVMSRDLAREAVKRLGLVGNPEFDPMVRGVGPVKRLLILMGLADNPLDRAPEERVLGAYYDRLLVYPVGKSRIVTVEFRSRDPDLAARAANTIADLYLSFQETAKKDAARSASTWLGANIDALRGRVAEAEAKVEEFRARTGLLMGPNNATLAAQQLSDLNTQLVQARTQQADSQAKARLIRDLIRDGRAFEIPDVANNELIRRLIEQRVNLRAQLALELRTLLPGHPRIKELNAQLADLESQIRGAGERTARMLENEAVITGSRVASLQAAVDAQKTVVAQANESEVPLRALEREARVQREQLESYLARYREALARNAENAAPPDARIISRAIAPATPSFPKKLPTTLLVTLVTVIFVAGAIIARELLARPERPAAWMPLPVDVATIEPASSPARRIRPAAPEDMPQEAQAGPDDPPATLRAGSDGPAQDAVPEAPAASAQESGRDRLNEAPVQGSGAFLGTLPEGPAAEAADAPGADLPSEERHDFDALIQRLSQAEPDGRGRRVLVTGLGPHDAVEVARGLGRALARKGRAIVVSVDGLPGLPIDRFGFTDLVAGEASFADIIEREPGSRLHLVAPGTLDGALLAEEWKGVDVALQAFDQTYDWVIALLHDSGDRSLLALLAPRVDAVAIASDADPSSAPLVDLYEVAKSVGAPDVVVARERVIAETADPEQSSAGEAMAAGAADAEEATPVAHPLQAGQEAASVGEARPVEEPVAREAEAVTDEAPVPAEEVLLEPGAPRPGKGSQVALPEPATQAVARRPEKPAARKRKKAREVA